MPLPGNAAVGKALLAIAKGDHHKRFRDVFADGHSLRGKSPEEAGISRCIVFWKSRKRKVGSLQSSLTEFSRTKKTDIQRRSKGVFVFPERSILALRHRQRFLQQDVDLDALEDQSALPPGPQTPSFDMDLQSKNGMSTDDLRRALPDAGSPGPNSP